jgi:zinc/manganese transport system permease protein
MKTMEALQFLLVPFLGCVVLVLIHAYFGIHILERGVIFLDLSLAQFVAVGIAVSLFLGQEGSSRQIYALAFAVLGASIFSFSRQIGRHVNIEAFIGVLYVFSLSAAILILDRTPHGLEEFKAILNGNILWVTPGDVLSTFVLYAAVGLLQGVLWRRFLALSRGGPGGLLMELLFFGSFAVVLVKSVQIAGVLQVFAFLLLPALTGRLFSREPAKILIAAWLTGTAVTTAALALSFRFDVPTAPVIVALLALTFFAGLAIKMAREGSSGASRG